MSNIQTLVEKFIFYEQLCLIEFEDQVKPKTPEFEARRRFCERILCGRSNMDIVAVPLTPANADTYWSSQMQLAGRCVLCWLRFEHSLICSIGKRSVGWAG